MRINVIKSSMPPFEEYMEVIRPLWDSVWLTNMGVNHEKLTKELCKYLKVSNVSLFVNGHMALEMALHVSQRVLTLPMSATLALDDVDRICDIVRSCGKEKKD